MNGQDPNTTFEFDIHRSIILAHYARFWSIPRTRYSVVLHDSSPLEVYSFPPENEEAAYRFATVGASAKHAEAPSRPHWELFLAIPSNLCGATEQSVLEFLADLAAYGVFGKTEYNRGILMPEVPSIPSSWPTRTIAFDLPLCEPENFTPIHVGEFHIDLLWVVLVHTSEQQLIQERGMSVLYTQCDEQGWHPTDPRRPPLR